MYLIRVLPGLRYISGKPQHIWRTVQCRGVHLRNGAQQSNVKPLTWSLHLSRGLVLHALRRTFLKPGVNEVQPYIYGRCFSSQPVSPEDGVLIYTGNLGKAVLGVKFFSYSTSMFSLCVMPYVLTKTGLGASSLAMKVAFCGFIGFFTFLTPALLHLITKGYVVRLYHNKDTDMYTAVTYSVLLMEKKTVFHQSDVKIPDCLPLNVLDTTYPSYTRTNSGWSFPNLWVPVRGLKCATSLKEKAFRNHSLCI
uniref:Uncharacterized protein n=1 Tax=Pygocentrus nattereri TaxID=42514 RepID=A0A3B4E6W5_PYGNA